MKQPTKCQLKTLKALNPYVGKITYKDAASQLGVTEDAIKERMKRLKQRCPEIYQRFINLKKSMNEGQRAVNKASIIDPGTFKSLEIERKW